MKKISTIEFINFKAFYGSGASNRLHIPQGKHLLIYGENGSGKSSIYEGLRQFFHSLNDRSIAPARNIHSEEEAVGVELTFSDGSSQVFPHNSAVPPFLKKTALLNSFLSYKELFKTYLITPANFPQQFTYLFIEEIVGRNQNSSTGRTFKEDWDDLFRPKANKTTKEAELVKFNEGLAITIQRINLILNEILLFFDPHLQVKILYDEGYIEYAHNAKTNDIRLYPEYNIWLEVKQFGKSLEVDEQSHLTILNEARLSALSLAIYLSALINTEQSGFEYKILALDDIFIGLDMGNRLPLLRILSEFKKPIFTQFVGENGEIEERIKEVNGEKQYEATPFFDSYQVFMTTYDRNWYEVAKDWFEHKAKDKWAFFEMYVDNITHSFDVPVIIENKTHLEKAEYYLLKHDYPACGMYLRKECEKVLSNLLKPAYRIKDVTLSDKAQNYLTEQKRLNDLILNFKDFCLQEAIDYTDFEDLGIYKDALLNPLSHNDIDSPIFKAELLTIIAILHKLMQINIIEVPNTQGKEALFIFNDTYSAEIKLTEKVLLLHQNGQRRLINVCKVLLKSTRKNGIEDIHKKGFDSLQEVYKFLCNEFGLTCNLEDISNHLEFRGKKLQDMITEI